MQIWADVKKKHSSHALTADVCIGGTAHALEFMRGDAVIVSGLRTGDRPSEEDASAVKRSTSLPLYLGSGVTAKNIAALAPWADGFIVGSEFKREGHWANPVDPARVERLLAERAASDSQ